MNGLFLATVLFVFLTIAVESLSLILQLRGRLLTKWLGTSAFGFHMAVTCSLWIVTMCLMAVLQWTAHPRFHDSAVLQYAGLALGVPGLVVALWGFKLIGLRRALCLNFFKEDVAVVDTSLYKYIKNPIDYGFWTALIGFALVTGSLYNLVVAIEFIVIMIPHMMLENVRLKQ
jgi:protein-S-isoprenylcysteine O-methyltransferase Ste14